MVIRASPIDVAGSEIAAAARKARSTSFYDCLRTLEVEYERVLSENAEFAAAAAERLRGCAASRDCKTTLAAPTAPAEEACGCLTAGALPSAPSDLRCGESGERRVPMPTDAPATMGVIYEGATCDSNELLPGFNSLSAQWSSGAGGGDLGGDREQGPATEFAAFEGSESFRACRSSRFSRVSTEESRVREELVEHERRKGCALEDVDAIKETLRTTSEKRVMALKRSKSSALEQVYKKGGCATRLYQARKFEYVSLAVIAFNALWISIDTDMNTDKLDARYRVIFTVVDNLFCSFFTFEVLVQFLAFTEKRKACRNGWFVFNCLLMVQMVFETWVMPLLLLLGGNSVFKLGPLANLRILRLLRLTRLLRMARIMRAMPELVFMLKGMLKATRSVGFTLLMLFCFLYVAGITVRQLAEGTESISQTYFPTVPASMYVLSIHCALLDEFSGVMNDVIEESYVVATVLGVVVLLAAVTMMNMLVGVLCEVMSTVAGQEKEKMAQAYVRSKVKQILQETDVDQNRDGYISIQEFQNILLHPDAISALKEVDVDPIALVDFADFIFQSDKEGQKFDNKLDFESFMDLVMALRGNNTATVKDVVALRQFIHAQNTDRNIHLARMEDRMRFAMEERTRMTEKLEVLEDLVSRQDANAAHDRAAFERMLRKTCSGVEEA
eukprot:TRINITY_DN26064_c0_g1_i4.p1 TRINITY_DN26064_c0_g1~~TRINITY_DN26064_c0_g1_i4.p1  ORF type:complete len:672 (-),score=156.50 TRINITY_DN26064_c0_g1_i4:256-2271(-)